MDTYHGRRPFSEIEVLNVARYLYKNRHNLIGYMDIHAYSQLWMTPWGYTRTLPKDYNEMVGFRSGPMQLFRGLEAAGAPFSSPESALLLKNRDLWTGSTSEVLDSRNSRQM